MQFMLLALCNVALARRVEKGDGVQVPAQRPISYFRASVSEKDLSEVARDVANNRRDATIKLFPPSPLAFRHSFNLGCKDSSVNTITLQADVCLSGDFYLNHNMLISEAPTCPDGSRPTMNYYPARGCIGETQIQSTKIPNPYYCLWGGIAPKYWSLIFRCGPDASNAQGAHTHEVAIPPPGSKPISHEGDVRAGGNDGIGNEGILVLGDECRYGLHKGALISVDKCIATRKSINIKRAAICPNGTRAQLARFETPNCNDGNISKKYGLIDIHDKDLSVEQCLVPNPGEKEDVVRSVAFWCEGIDAAPHKPINRQHGLPGVFSEEACSGGKPGPIPLRHKLLQPDTCTPSPKTNSREFMISRPALCANGSMASLALYGDDDCRGQPEILDVGFSAIDINKCLYFASMRSWAFYCDGEGLGDRTSNLRVSSSEVMEEPPSGSKSTSAPEIEIQVAQDLEPGVRPDPKMVDPSDATKAALQRDPIIPSPEPKHENTLEYYQKQLIQLERENKARLMKERHRQNEASLREETGRETLAESKHETTLQYYQKQLMQLERDNRARPMKERHRQDVALLGEETGREKNADGARVEFRKGRGSVSCHNDGEKEIGVSLASDSHLNHPKNSFDIPPIAISRNPLPNGGIFSSAACKPTKGKLPTLSTAAPGTCILLAPHEPLMISFPATCSNGKYALLAFYKDGDCGDGGQPDEFGSLDLNVVDRCFTYDDFKSWEFWCDGIALESSESSAKVVRTLFETGTHHEVVRHGFGDWLVIGLFILAVLLLLVGISLAFGAVISRGVSAFFRWRSESSIRLSDDDIVFGTGLS